MIFGKLCRAGPIVGKSGRNALPLASLARFRSDRYNLALPRWQNEQTVPCSLVFLMDRTTDQLWRELAGAGQNVGGWISPAGRTRKRNRSISVMKMETCVGRSGDGTSDFWSEGKTAGRLVVDDRLPRRCGPCPPITRGAVQGEAPCCVTQGFGQPRASKHWAEQSGTSQLAKKGKIRADGNAPMTGGTNPKRAPSVFLPPEDQHSLRWGLGNRDYPNIDLLSTGGRRPLCALVEKRWALQLQQSLLEPVGQGAR